MARNICMLVAYDGTDFHGWQDQPEVRTVQQVLEQAVRRAIRHQVSLVGSGRTDTGVHAAGQVSSFETTCSMPVERLRHSIGSRLPKDVSVIHLREVHSDFHATRSATCKLYRYRIYNHTSRPVEHLAQRYAYHYWHPLDVEKMAAAARFFVGEMDFTSMAGRGEERQSMVRRVIRCDVARRAEEVRVDVMGTGFLYKQVRNMVGTLLNVGRGHWTPQRVAEILASRDRTLAGPTAPARGLCLQWVRYPPQLLVSPGGAAKAEAKERPAIDRQVDIPGFEGKPDSAADASVDLQ